MNSCYQPTVCSTDYSNHGLGNRIHIIGIPGSVANASDRIPRIPKYKIRCPFTFEFGVIATALFVSGQSTNGWSPSSRFIHAVYPQQRAGPDGVGDAEAAIDVVPGDDRPADRSQTAVRHSMAIVAASSLFLDFRPRARPSAHSVPGAESAGLSQHSRPRHADPDHVRSALGAECQCESIWTAFALSIALSL